MAIRGEFAAMTPPITQAFVEQLIADNKAMRKAGGLLAEAAIAVVTDYDGCHRLSLAVSDWAKVIANEGGRGERHDH